MGRLPQPGPGPIARHVAGHATAFVWSLVTLVLLVCPAPAHAQQIGGATTRGLPLPTQPRAALQAGPVRPGIEVLLADSLGLVRGQRVGLITNHTGRDRAGTPTIDLLATHPAVELVALYSPEHGIRGNAEAGVSVAGGVDERTGVPIYSLYGETRKPTDKMLEGIEVLLFDIQDVGTRYYTYLSTMALAMEAAGEHGIPFVVLDRPNPIGGDRVHGNILDPGFTSFVGPYPLPMRHGLTAGEFARMVVGEFGVRVELTVVVADGWRRTMSFEDTGIPWVAPSPNMPSIESALHYPGTCLFEGTSISVGRGTDRAFQQVGGPWLDADDLAIRLAALNIPDVLFLPVRFTPVEPGDGKFGGMEVEGVRLIADGPAYDPTLAALALLVEIKEMSREHWSWRPGHFDRLAGTDALRLALDDHAPFRELVKGWGEGLPAYLDRRRPYLLYLSTP